MSGEARLRPCLAFLAAASRALRRVSNAKRLSCNLCFLELDFAAHRKRCFVFGMEKKIDKRVCSPGDL